MKKLLLGLLILVVVLLGVGIALPFVLPREMIKAELEQRLTAELGREVRVEGPLELRPWPPLALTLAEVSIANPDWANEPSLARIDRLDLEVDALAYLGGTIALERLLIERPTLALEIDTDGTPSWQLAPAGDEAGDEHGGGSGAGDERQGDLPTLRIGEIRLTEGTVTLDDHGSGETRRFEALELWARGEPDGPALNLDGSVTSQGERATLNAVIGDLDALLAGEPSSLTLEAAAPGLGIAADGEASPSGSALLAVTADAAPRRLLDWLGQPVELPEGRLEEVTLAVDAAGSPTGLALRALTLEVDDLRIAGDLELAMAERPKLTGSLDLGNLDLRPYLEPGEGSAAADAPADSDTEAADGWPKEPLNLPLPLPLDVDLGLQLASLVTHELELGAGSLSLTADADETTADIDELALYDGTLTGRVTLGNGETVDLDASAEVTAVQLEPLLAAVADIDWLAGTGNARFAVTSEGASIDALMRNLDGDGELSARDGAILGINIGATMRQVMTLGVHSAAAEPQRTDFAEAGGTFTIEEGVLDNQDFSLDAPALRVNGAGTIDLGAQTLDYRLLPRLAGTLEGQDASGDAAFQAGVPLVIEGAWADPTIRLDLDGTLTGDIGDPAALAATVQNIARDPAMLENLRDSFDIAPDSPLGEALQGLGGLLGGGQRPAAGETDAPDPDSDEAPARDPARELLEGLGGLLRR